MRAGRYCGVAARVTCRHLLREPCAMCASDRALAEKVRKGTRGRYLKGEKQKSKVRVLEEKLRRTQKVLREVWRRAAGEM